ncbi:MAG: ABC transporter ATP-binding protein [Patescibacteria group bacterium]
MVNKDYSIPNLIKDIWIYLKPYKGKFLFATFLRIIAEIVSLYSVYALALLIDFFTNFKEGQSIIFVYQVFVIWILMAIIRQIGRYYSTLIAFNIANRTAIDSEFVLLKHLLLLDMDWHEKENSGNKVKRIDRGSSGIEKILRIWIGNFIEIVVSFFGMVLIIAKFDAYIGILTFVFILSFYLLSRIYRKRGVIAGKIANIQEEQVSGLFFELISNIRTVKVLGMGKNLVTKIGNELNDLHNKITKRIFIFQLGGSTLSFYGNVYQIGITIFIAFGIMHGVYQVSFLVLFYTYFNRVWGSVQQFVELSDTFASAKTDIFRMQELLDVLPNIDIETDKVMIPPVWQTIHIKNVSFSYGDKMVLDNVSFDIPRGKKIGIVGLSGAGKSTLFKLLLKENESYDGDILFGDISLKNISKKDYQKHTAVVLQETELFNTSLKENIVIEEGVNINEESIESALETAHVKDFMNKLPLGVETVVGEKGVKLSGGEKQRVGIARAVYKKPELLLMDEATSHLDIESEKKIQESLHKFFKQVTAVVIAHRLTTIKEMDIIVVLENGAIVESGDFNELYNKKGRFFELWEKQKL